jgi:hypothetical protein
MSKTGKKAYLIFKKWADFFKPLPKTFFLSKCTWKYGRKGKGEEDIKQDQIAPTPQRSWTPTTFHDLW